MYSIAVGTKYQTRDVQTYDVLTFLHLTLNQQPDFIVRFVHFFVCAFLTAQFFFDTKFSVSL